MKLFTLFSLTLLSSPVDAASMIGVTNVAPITAVIGTATQITIEASITDPLLIANGVNLLQINQDGTAVILGTMHDDGLNGDTLSGDHVFTLVTTLDAASPTQVQLQVSAEFKKQLVRVRSPILSVFFQPANAADLSIAALATALNAGNIASALQFFVPSERNTSVVQSMNSAQLAASAKALRTATLASSGPDNRTYQMSWIEPDGSTTPVEITLVPNALGQWVISNW